MTIKSGGVDRTETGGPSDSNVNNWTLPLTRILKSHWIIPFFLKLWIPPSVGRGTVTPDWVLEVSFQKPP